MAVFSGSPNEYTEAHRACLESAGFTVKGAPEGMSGAFEIDQNGLTEAELGEAVERCNEAIGMPDMTALSEEQVRASYEMRVSVQECLVANDWSSKEPLGWEAFRDQWSKGNVWEPMVQAVSEASTSDASQAQITCDRYDGDTW